MTARCGKAALHNKTIKPAPCVHSTRTARSKHSLWRTMKKLKLDEEYEVIFTMTVGALRTIYRR